MAGKSSRNSSKNSRGKTTRKTNGKPAKKSTRKTKRDRGHLAKGLALCGGLWLVFSICLLVSLQWTRQLDEFMRIGGAYDPLAGQNIQTAGVSDASMNVHFVDVGQGDATILELPDGQIMLVDGGPHRERVKLQEYISNNIFRNGLPLDKFDIALLTHSDEDHCGGMDDALTLWPADVLYRPNILSGHPDWVDPGTAQITSNKAHNTVAYRDLLRVGYESPSTQVRVLTQPIQLNSQSDDPDKQYQIDIFVPKGNHSTSYNNFSPVIVVEFAGRRVVMSGDAEERTELSFVGYLQDTRGDIANFYADIIKLGHHGSDTSSTQEYLAALTWRNTVSATQVVISCGRDNTYGHPHADTLVRCEVAGIERDNILRTDRDGDIAFCIKYDDQSQSFRVFRGAAMLDNAQIPTLQYLTWPHFCCLAIVISFGVLVAPWLWPSKRT